MSDEVKPIQNTFTKVEVYSKLNSNLRNWTATNSERINKEADTLYDKTFHRLKCLLRRKNSPRKWFSPSFALLPLRTPYWIDPTRMSKDEEYVAVVFSNSPWNKIKFLFGKPRKMKILFTFSLDEYDRYFMSRGMTSDDIYKALNYVKR